MALDAAECAPSIASIMDLVAKRMSAVLPKADIG
jgi:hypothetical protein